MVDKLIEDSRKDLKRIKKKEEKLTS